MDTGKLLQGQVALVTGASSGIGREIACAMAEAGAKVVVDYYSNRQEAEKVVQHIRENGGTAVSFQADVSCEEQVKKMFSFTCKTFGTLDILVNNAGIQRDADFLNMSLEKWQKVLDTNLTGSFLCAREAAREFCRRGVVPETSRAAGKIIFISSVHDTIPWAGRTNYAASKGGMMLLMKSLAQELAPYRIRANSIAPGAIKTSINREAWRTPDAEASLLRLIPYDRIGLPEDIAPVAVWLASDQADYITGVTIYVDGGMLLYPGFRTGG